MDKLLENKVFRLCLIAVIVIVLLMILIAVIVGNRTRKVTDYGLINAAKKYYENNQSLLPKEKYDSSTLSLATLVSTGYISQNLEGSTCPSYVTVTNMGGTYDYNANIVCNAIGTTTTLLNKILINTTTSGSGLYNQNGSYIFRGENPNNYVKIGNFKWRIIGLDENRSIKIIYSDLLYSQNYNEWDDRYNKEVDNQRGVNDYVTSEKSRLKEYLDNFLSTEINGEYFTGKTLSLLTKHSVCIGKVNLEAGVNNACSKKLSDQRVSTLSISDYVNASLDTSCSYSNSINCQNYNFLNNYGWTINASSANTYEAYYIDEYEGLKTQFASLRSPVRPVVSLKNNVVYVSGTGTELDPYIIR